LLTSSQRTLTTHAGSLPRPEHLRELVVRRASGKPVDAQTYEAEVKSAVAEVVRRQVETGLDVVSDGEMSKPGFFQYVAERFTGFEGGESTPVPRADLADFPAYAERVGAVGAGVILNPACVGPVKLKDRAGLERDLANLAVACTQSEPSEAFVPAASPGIIAQNLRNHFYPSDEAYLTALAEALREEYALIVARGFVLQVDCPDLAMGRHVLFADAPLEEFRRSVELHIEALNHALEGLPPDRLRLHLCWGNYPGPHHRDVPLRDILDIVLKARPLGLSMEAANPRHGHEWQVFESVELPEDKVLIPGVIDSCSNYIEHPDLVAQRIVGYASLVGRERVIAGSDCGFGTSAVWSTVDPAIAWAKLASLVEGARLASHMLWT
jgi:5-methyltetrahydropteroyltriglutamate--homocysteine methyltransferase